MIHNKNMYLITLDRAGHDRTCNYWYLIHADYGTSHWAFNRRESLMQWLEERGLKLTAPLPDHGVYSSQKIAGEYGREMHMSYDEFYALPAIIETRTLDNGSWTLARITEAGGERTVHVLNCNCKHRPVLDYRESNAMLG